MRPIGTYLFLGNALNVYCDSCFRWGMQLKIRVCPCNIRVTNANDSHKYIYLAATSLEIVYEVNNSDSGEGA